MVWSCSQNHHFREKKCGDPLFKHASIVLFFVSAILFHNNRILIYIMPGMMIASWNVHFQLSPNTHKSKAYFVVIYQFSQHNSKYRIVLVMLFSIYGILETVWKKNLDFFFWRGKLHLFFVWGWNGENKCINSHSVYISWSPIGHCRRARTNYAWFKN